MSKECTTHHFACDCREAKFKQLEQENAALRRDVYQCPPTSENDYEGFKWNDACEELERENAALRADIHAHEQINKQLIEDKRRLDWLTDTGCWLTFPSLSKHPNWKYGTARDVIDLARKEAQP